MHLIAIGWIYVVLMMAVAEALSSQGTVLGALFTFVLYGVLPLVIVLYIVATPARKKALRMAAQREAALAAGAPAGPDTHAVAAPSAGSEPAPASVPGPAASAPPSAPRSALTSAPPDGGRHAAGATVTPERKEP
jgi:hypothetical protein